MTQQTTIDAKAAYAEACSLNKYYHDRNLLLANAISALNKEKQSLEAEIERLNGLLTAGEVDIQLEGDENGSS